MSTKYAVVDLFAGPGGLAEGFASVRADDGEHPFRIALSIEKEASAHETLLLRSFLRQFDGEFPPEYYDYLNGGTREPNWSALYPAEWQAAVDTTLCLELGAPGTEDELVSALNAVHNVDQENVIVIGGPPCQAYSLAGRARNRGIKGYNADNDQRHYLYQEYIGILKRLQPAGFVMENVKGMLSSSVNGNRVFNQVRDDLAALDAGGEGYALIPLSPSSNRMLKLNGMHPPPGDFVVQAEDFGLPQARHRVIVVGVRRDIAARFDPRTLEQGLLGSTKPGVTVRDVLQGMPKLRSGLSRSEDSEAAWRKEVCGAMRQVAELGIRLQGGQTEEFRRLANVSCDRLEIAQTSLQRTGARPVGIGPDCPNDLREWILDPKLEMLSNNETRSHMPTDFARYVFAAMFADVCGSSPKMRDFPAELAPNHQSWAKGDFPDRFRVQVWDQPSSTVTSHIAKDGHYFIHPDPEQCRTLTVREAARLQTFPDNYLFKGNRTQQYVQVGNAVPPFLARQIAESLFSLLETANRH